MTPNRAVPAECLALIHEFEQGPEGGFAAKPYKDPAGVWTIGWGHALYPKDPLVTGLGRITPESADEFAAKDLDEAGCELEAVLGQTLVDALSEGRWAALIDFVFNEGIGHFQGSMLCTLLKKSLFAEAGSEFKRWIYGGRPPKQLPGLVRRRDAESKLWAGEAWR